jgi:hypothetical protein
MAESGIDLSFDDPIPAKMSITTGSGGIRVIGIKSPSPNTMSTSMPPQRNSLKQSRLRSSQRLQLMKMQAETEAKRAAATQQSIPSTGSASSLPSTTHHSFLGSYRSPSGSLIINSHSSGSMLANMHDYAAPSFYNPNNPMDEEDLLSDISGVIEDEFSSCGSFNIPSLANSCIAEITMERREGLAVDDESQTSSSCPLIPLHSATAIQPYRGGRKKEAPPPFQSEESKMMWLKEREKKDQHNTIEKKRRSKINDYIHELATLLPENYDIDLQNKKGNILEASVDYIRKLQTDEKRLHQMKKQQEELEKQNRRLHLQIQLFQSMNMPPQMQQPPQQPQIQPQPPPQPAATPPEVLMPPPATHLQADHLSPHHQLHHHQLVSDTQFQATDDNLFLSLEPHTFSDEVHSLDFLPVDLFSGELGLDNLDPIFAGLHVVAPKSAGDHQIPLVVEEYMDMQ